MLDNKKAKKLLNEITKVYEDKKQELSKYDSIIGDGDHGFSLARGCNAANNTIDNMPQDSSIYEYFKIYGRTLTCEIGGAMGPLFGLLFTEIGKQCDGKEVLGLKEFAMGMHNACIKIMDLGGAKVGDKTMVDAIVPVDEVLKRSILLKSSFKETLEEVVETAEIGVKSTIPLQAKRGRSKYLREKSIGHQDAGATSFYYFTKAFSDFVSKED